MHQRYGLLSSLALVALTACGSANEDGGNEAGVGGGGAWGTATNVEAIFASSCTQCHASTWDSCWTVQANQASIQEAIESGAMPQNGPLAASEKATLLAWLADGAPCVGPEPDGGAPIIGFNASGEVP